MSIKIMINFVAGLVYTDSRHIDKLKRYVFFL